MAPAYTVSFDRAVLAPGSTYTCANLTSNEALRRYLSAAGYGDQIGVAFPLGYDDISFQFTDKAAAKAFALAMDDVVPGPTKKYRQCYGADGTDVHHAVITSYADETLESPIDTFRPEDL